jgi:hypothetical protein
MLVHPTPLQLMLMLMLMGMGMLTRMLRQRFRR